MSLFTILKYWKVVCHLLYLVAPVYLLFASLLYFVSFIYSWYLVWLYAPPNSFKILFIPLHDDISVLFHNTLHNFPSLMTASIVPSTPIYDVVSFWILSICQHIPCLCSVPVFWVSRSLLSWIFMSWLALANFSNDFLHLVKKECLETSHILEDQIHV